MSGAYWSYSSGEFDTLEHPQISCDPSNDKDLSGPVRISVIGDHGAVQLKLSQQQALDLSFAISQRLMDMQISTRAKRQPLDSVAGAEAEKAVING